MRLVLLLIAGLSLGISSCATMKSSKASVISATMSKEEQEMLSPEQALQELKNGNERFVSGLMRQRDLQAQIALSQKQYPFAVILSCMDSRGPPEMVFDQGIGDIFVERLAGNVVNGDILGGMEFGTELSGAKLVLVLGHSSCGAVRGACENVQLGNLTPLLEKIKPAVDAIHQEEASPNCDDASIDKMAWQNVQNVIANIKNESPVLMKLLEQKKIALVGAIHDLKTGRVHFY